MQATQLGPRLDTQLIDQHPAGVPIGGQRFGPAPAPEQDQHQPGAQVQLILVDTTRRVCTAVVHDDTNRDVDTAVPILCKTV